MPSTTPVRCSLAAGLLALAALPAAATAQLSFTDQTAASGLRHTHTPPAGPPTSPMLSGGATGDFDGDGWPDLFVTGGGGVPDRLFLNDGSGSFTDHAAAWGVDVAHVGAGSAVGDVDADGDLDLFVTSHGSAASMGPGAHKLYRNDGAGFTEIAAAAGVAFASPHASDGYGVTFGDRNLDGDLDLFVAGWVSGSLGNRLFDNAGDGTFSDVTASAIAADLTDVHAFSPHFVDMDGDLAPELLIAADFGTSRYLVNDGTGSYTDATASSGTGLDSNGMGQNVADLDGDLRPDWSVTSIFANDASGSGNMLYRNDGAHVFTEMSAAAGVNDGGWGWGIVAADVDHDADLDLIETNGWSAAEWLVEPLYLFLNDGNANFTESAQGSGLIYDLNGRGLLHLDADGDGDRDIVAFCIGGPLTYFRNELSGRNTHWLGVELDDGGHAAVAPDGYGARVELLAGGGWQLRLVSGDNSFLSQSQLDAHFGLGAASIVDELRVTWPDGSVRTLKDVAADQTLSVTCCAGWKDLGSALAGGAGTPHLTGAGTLLAGDDITLSLTDAAPSAPTTLVVGLSELSAPFKGGLLVPSPDILISGLTTDAAGQLDLSSTWPTGLPPEVAIVLQHWITDALAPAGLAASNGLRALTP